MTLSTRKDFYKFENGEKPPLQFSQAEYDLRINGLRNIMIEMGIEATVLNLTTETRTALPPTPGRCCHLPNVQSKKCCYI